MGSEGSGVQAAEQQAPSEKTKESAETKVGSAVIKEALAGQASLVEEQKKDAAVQASPARTTMRDGSRTYGVKPEFRQLLKQAQSAIVQAQNTESETSAEAKLSRRDSVKRMLVIPEGFEDLLSSNTSSAKKQSRPDVNPQSCIGGKNDQAGVSPGLKLARAFSEAAPVNGESRIENQVEQADTTKLDDKSKLHGELKSPDGKSSYKIEDGKLSDRSGKIIGSLDKNGKFQAENSQGKTDINSAFNGWSFSGSEDGKARVFECNSDLSSGKVFLNLDAERKVECDVKMGMLIDKKTGEQLGNIEAPHETKNGDLVGGKLKFFESPPGELALSDLKNTTFDLELMGQSGINSRRIQGVALGAEKLADGRTAPGSGGLLNVQDSLVVLEKHQKDIRTQESANTGLIGYVSGEQSRLSQEHSEALERGQSQIQELKAAVEKGDTSNLGAARFGIENANKIDDPLMRLKSTIDKGQEHLEKLPTDTSVLNGEIRIPSTQADGQSSIQKFEVKAGNLVDKDGEPILKIENDHGQMFLTELKTNQRRAAHELAGASFDLKIGKTDNSNGVKGLQAPDKFEADNRLRWISTGDRFVSIDDLNRRAEAIGTYTLALNDKSQSDESLKRATSTIKAADEFVSNVQRIFEDGIKSGAEFEMLNKGPEAIRKEAFEQFKPEVKASDLRDQRRIQIPVLAESTDKTQNQFSPQAIESGKLRVGNEVFTINHGELIQDGKKVGDLNAGYKVSLDDGRKFSLADENRVVMQFKFAGENKEHQILGLGKDRISQDGKHIQGGLVEKDQLVREGLECRQKALEGDKEYFAKKPYLNEMFKDRLNAGDLALEQVSENIDSQVRMLDSQMDFIFKESFDLNFQNNRLDESVKVTQQLVSNLSFSATTSEQISREGIEVNKQVNDAMVTGVITVATGGLSAWVSAGRAVTLATAAGRAVVGETVLASAAAGGAISAVGRVSSVSDDVRNANAGMIEGVSNAAGALGGKWLEAAKLGTGGQAAYRVADAVTQSVLGTAAGVIRDGDASAFNLKTISIGAAANLASFGVGMTVSHVSEKIAGSLSKQLGNNLQKAAQALNASEDEVASLLRKSPDLTKSLLAEAGVNAGRLETELSLLGGLRTGTAVVGDGISGYSSGFATAMSSGVDVQKERLSAQFGVSKSEITGELLTSNLNWGELVDYCHESGITAAQSAMATSALLSPISRRLDEGVKDKANAYRIEVENNKIRPSQSDIPNGFKRIEGQDGKYNLESQVPGALRLEFDAEGKLQSAVDHKGTNSEFFYDHDTNELSEITTGDLTFTKHDKGWKLVVDGDYDNEINVPRLSVGEDGAISYSRERSNGSEESRILSLDGTVREPYHGRLLKVDHEHEKTKLDHLISTFENKADQAIAQAYMAAVETHKALTGWSDQEIGKTFHEISQMLVSETSILSHADRAAIAVEVLGNVIDPFSLNQGQHNTCNVATATVRMYAHRPSEAARILKEIVSTGQVGDGDGGKIVLSKNDITHDAETRIAHNRELMIDDPAAFKTFSERNLADKILQTAIVNSYWKGVGFFDNEKSGGRQYFPVGEIKWTHDSNGKSMLRVQGQELSDSPEFETWQITETYRSLTGDFDPLVLAHTAYSSRTTGPARRFSSEESFINVSQEVSVTNPMVIMVNCEAEPFYSDSGAGRAGGSDGLHVVTMQRPPVKINGEYYVYLDNTWGPAAQHTTETGRPVKLHDLYMAMLPRGSKERIDMLAAEGMDNPLKLMEYYRALQTYTDLSGGNVRQEDAAYTIKTEEHYKMLEGLRNSVKEDPSSWASVSKEEIATFLEYSESTLGLLQRQILKRQE